ncbi:MAG: rhamnulokinase, partial [Actinobacteria bacterium]|nr:rhamnulokinase [Actinomycetota bacterium]
MSVTVAAVDLGASSGRVLVGRFGGDETTLREVHRFANHPIRPDGVLRWDLPALLRGVLDGLRKAEQLAGPLDSIGVDSWAVDYGTLDADGTPGPDPVHYRNGDTTEAVATVHETLGAERLFAATGIQHLPFNTVFQLVARRPSGEQLLIADLVNVWLCGVRGTEATN